MSVGLRLDLRQSQNLVMTPQLQQAIKLLQMSNIELRTFVDSEVERNPLLRLDAPESEAPAVSEEQAVAPTDTRADDHTLAEDTFDTGRENLHDAATADLPQPLGRGTAPDGRSVLGMDTLPSWEERLAEKPSLRDHLRAQIGQVRRNGQDVATALYLVEELDENGYVRAELVELAERLGASVSTVEAGLALLQSSEPTGIGARDLAECFRLQLQDRGPLDQPMHALLENLDLLGQGDFRRLRMACGVTDAELSAMVRQLRRLDPRPGAAFDTVEPETLIPDILLRRTSWGGWHLELNPDTLPAVLIDRRYAAQISRSRCADSKQFLADCQSTANWLIKSLDQRSRTIVKIASEVVRQQEDFFADGIRGLRPLTLRTVADAVGMHESTVSRVTANKYMHTERGIFQLKFFFTNALGAGDGDVAAEAVRHRIKTMVDAEPANAILSDDAIVECLTADGIEIARRTVAKYRKSLNIPSSIERRRLKSINAAL